MFMIAKVTFKPALWSPEVHCLVVGSIRLNNVVAKKPDASWMALLPTLQKTVEHKADAVGFDLNQAAHRADQWLPHGTIYFKCKGTTAENVEGADCVGFWISAASALLADQDKPITIKGKVMTFLPADLGLRHGDYDPHVTVKVDIAWKRIRKDATAAAKRARNQAARKIRKRDAGVSSTDPWLPRPSDEAASSTDPRAAPSPEAPRSRAHPRQLSRTVVKRVECSHDHDLYQLSGLVRWLA